MSKYTSDEIIKERERWLGRFKGHFGEPPRLEDWKLGSITFEELYHSAMKFADNMLAEVQYVQSCAFHDTRKVRGAGLRTDARLQTECESQRQLPEGGVSQGEEGK